MTPDEWNAYLKNVQSNEALDRHALAAHVPLVNQLNATVRDAASRLIQFEDEPAQFVRALRELRR